MEKHIEKGNFYQNKKDNNDSILHGEFISSVKYTNPNYRIAELKIMRIFTDERIDEVLELLKLINNKLSSIKSQISAHDYNICNKFKK